METEQRLIDVLLTGMMIGITSAAVILGIAEIIYIINQRKKQRR